MHFAVFSARLIVDEKQKNQWKLVVCWMYFIIVVDPKLNQSMLH